MKKLLALLISAASVVSFSACSSQQTEQAATKQADSKQTDTKQTDTKQTNTETEDKEVVYQVALLQSLTQGYYDGIIKVSELKQHGDIGIGTFEGVNGEMIVLDGKVYQALDDGTVKEADDNETVPFSNVTFFDSDISENVSEIKDMAGLKSRMDETVNKNGKNMFYVVKISGEFEKMLVRSELKQQKPYKPLDKALETDQREFTYDNIKGTIVGLYCPNYMSGLNAPGWHFHFISDDKTKGGHILELSFNKAQAEFDLTPKFEMKLSDNNDFQKMELAKDVDDAIKKVETNE